MKKEVCLALTSTLQIVLVIALVVLQVLSKKTAGLSHHLHYKQRYYLFHLFTMTNTMIMAAAILLLSLGVAAMAKKRKLDDRAKGLSTWAGVLILGLLLPQARALLIYPYMLGLLAICWVLSIIQCVLFIQSNKKA